MNKKKLTTKETFDLAVQNHKKNNFKIAEKLYKEILNIDPDHFKSIHLLGTLSEDEKAEAPKRKRVNKKKMLEEIRREAGAKPKQKRTRKKTK